jgi:hypothetical protein
MTTPEVFNPFASFRVSDTWRVGHQAVDYATPQGTLFVAPATGLYRHRPAELDDDTPGQAGIYGDIVLPNAYRIRVCHLDEHVAHDGAFVHARETLLAATGNTGYSFGPHMHTTGFDAAGNRWDWTRFAIPITPGGAALAGDGSTPFPDPPTEEEDMSFTEDDRKRAVSASKSLARIELALSRSDEGRFFKHGDMPADKPLWLYITPSGDFVRIRDKATAAIYKEINGGIQSTVLSGEAIRQLRDDLIAAGGRDLSAVEGTDRTVTTPDEVGGI